MKQVLQFKIADEKTLEYECNTLINIGYAGRDRQTVQKHIDELVSMGVKAPQNIPTIYPVSNYLATTTKIIQVQHSNTSGEVEYVVLISEDGIFIGVGSDHSDRELEKTSVPWAKQAYPNIISEHLWLYEELMNHWDKIILRSLVLKNDNWQLYQEDSLSALMIPEELMSIGGKMLQTDLKGVILFSGTIPTKKELICGDGYRLELFDPILNRSLLHEYKVILLPKSCE